MRPLRVARLRRGLLPARIRDDSRGVAPLLIAITAMNASNYLFHVAISRLLGPTAYGALTALLSLMLVLSVPFGVLQATVARRVAILRAEDGERDVSALAASTMAVVLPIAGVALVAIAAFSPLIAAFLHVGVGAVCLVAAHAFVSLLLSVPLGCLQGTMRFGAFARVTLAGVLVRFAVGLGLVWAGFGVPGALIGSIAAQALTLPLALDALGLTGRVLRGARPALELIRGGFAQALLGLGAFWLLAESDVVLARHFLDETASGYYSSGSVLARALLFLPGAISIAALPRFAELRTRGPELRRILKLALGSVAVLEVASLSILVLARERVVSVAFGATFAPAATILPFLAIAAGALALALVLVYFHIAVNTRAHMIVFGGAILQALLIVLFHESPEQVASCVALSALATTAVLAHAAFAACRWPPPVIDEVVEAAGPAEHRLSVVLPCHNGGDGLADVLAALAEELAQVDHEVVVVSDGSTDRTVEIARSFGAMVIDHRDRRGKGHALRAGLAVASGEYVAFMDADGDISPSAIRPFLTLMRLYEPDIVLGSKRHPLSEIEYPLLRRMLSWTYHKITRVLFRVNVRDTQTGMKLLRRDVLTAVLPLMLEKRYAFDLELLVVAKRLGYTRVFEAPIAIDYRFSSQIDTRQAMGILADSIGIFYRRYVLNTYGPKARRVHAVAEDRSLSVSEDGTTVALSSGEASEGAVSPLRVLIVNWRDIRNPEAGGAEVYTHEVAQRWVRAGHDVSLLTSRFAGSRSRETIDGVRVRRMGRLRRGTFHLLAQRELARLQGFDVVLDEINTIPFFAPVWNRGRTRTVALIHQLAEEVWDAELPRPLAALGRRIEPRMLSFYRDVPVATVSASTQADLLRIGLNDVRVVPQGRDEPPIGHRPPKEAMPTFLYVGRLAANKRPDHAVEAFRSIRQRLPEARLWIVGQGPMETALRSSLPDAAELLGFLSRADLYDRMARAHCLLVPSVREGWGMVITEANGVGTPAAGYDVPGVRDAIRDGVTGVVSETESPGSLADAALAATSDPRAYAEMCVQALAWASRFSWDVTAQALFDVIAPESLRVAAREAPPITHPLREEAPREFIPSLQPST